MIKSRQNTKTKWPKRDHMNRDLHTQWNETTKRLHINIEDKETRNHTTK